MPSGTASVQGGAAAAAKATRPGPGLFRLFRRKEPRGKSRAASDRRGDLIIAAMGLALACGCAVFPWYIFFHQEKFGIRPLDFAGNPKLDAPDIVGDVPDLLPNDIPSIKFDLFATGTVAPANDDEGSARMALEQPFPGSDIEYHLVYAGSGRAMIADESGMWVVQRGSILPDNSKVASIEQRGKTWILVTSKDKVIELPTQ